MSVTSFGKPLSALHIWIEISLLVLSREIAHARSDWLDSVGKVIYLLRVYFCSVLAVFVITNGGKNTFYA